ncbi:hypothetical protein [Geobacter pickeringii]|uniref:hypothetical protein n=1 Tax=Geobacter pickeringii TaxID=345632 RepID=UPI00130E5596|nr:hypothetical protein [Geobacter pickeringii]
MPEKLSSSTLISRGIFSTRLNDATLLRIYLPNIMAKKESRPVRGGFRVCRRIAVGRY